MSLAKFRLVNYLIYNKEVELKTLIILVMLMIGKFFKMEQGNKVDCAYKN